MINKFIPILLSLIMITVSCDNFSSTEIISSLENYSVKNIKSKISITDLEINDLENRNDWTFETDLNNGNETYGDRSFTITSLPDELIGCAWIKTANDSKRYNDSDILAILTTSNNMDLYIAVDNRIKDSLDWVTGAYSNWIDAEKEITDNKGETYSLYTQRVQENATVEFGHINENKCNMYFMIFKSCLSENISELEIYDQDNSANWSIEKGLNQDNRIYGDRDFTITSLPYELTGCEWIKTANNSKRYNESDIIAALTVSKDVDLFIAVDNRVDSSLEWLSESDTNWSITGENITSNNDVTYNLYMQSLQSGSSIDFGILNISRSNMYFMILKPRIEKPVKVFIMAGQSNMLGHGEYTDHNPDYNHLQKLIGNDPETYNRYMTDRSDVWIASRGKNPGELGVGFGDKSSRHFGIELAFGHVLGNIYQEKVLLVKIATGGTTLASDWRPPSASGSTGPYYNEMMAYTDDVLSDISDYWIDYQDQGYLISGFVWLQGWNDMVNEDYLADYEDNLVYLVDDIREDFHFPELPVLIIDSPNNGESGNHIALAQAKENAVARINESNSGTAVYLTTDATTGFWNPDDYGSAYHFNNSAETHIKVGKIGAEHLLPLLE